ncbi:MAG TPA: peroxide stress protein YaaA [Solirubrobacterales bacterium]|jgi:hypothetical protein|nr:peroxide stress protein YaaA [Solirubrobacterales bacterium]
MLILLPPSEGKATPADGAPVDLDSLVYAEQLGRKREQLLEALETLAAAPRKAAARRLGVSPGQAGEVEVGAGLRSAPAAPAAEVYSGVLYDRLGLAALSKTAQRRVLIASALWGVVRPEDRIPYYRFSSKARLGRIGPPATFWRPALAAALPDNPGALVVDMRSAAYAAAWKPKQATLLSVRAFSEQGGKRKVVSHMAKAVRGDVAKALLAARKAPGDAEAAADVVAKAGFEVELAGANLDVIVSG